MLGTPGSAKEVWGEEAKVWKVGQGPRQDREQAGWQGSVRKVRNAEFSSSGMTDSSSCVNLNPNWSSSPVRPFGRGSG